MQKVAWKFSLSWNEVVSLQRETVPESQPCPIPPLNIFISYAHADSAFVDRLETDLHKQGFDPWVDRQRLKGGQRWRRELQDAVKRAQVLLIVLSPDAVASQNVQIEYDYVLELGQLVIPLYCRQCEVPMELRAIQWIDFRQSYEQGIAFQPSPASMTEKGEFAIVEKYGDCTTAVRRFLPGR